MNEIIFVAGLGRCGTTAMMQALYRGGFPCFGVWPAFEEDMMGLRRGRMIERAKLEPLAGLAVKWLDPLNARIPAEVPRRVIFMRRDPVQQAKSMIKFTKLITGPSLGLKLPHGFGGWRDELKWVASIERDNPLAFEHATAGGRWPHDTITFEALLTAPFETIMRLGTGPLQMRKLMPLFNVGKATAAIRHRDAGCYDGLMELDMMKEAEPEPTPLQRVMSGHAREDETP